MHVFENNQEAINGLPRSLLSAFDNRSWIPVTNILFRLCKGSGFASSKNAESQSSATFQVFLSAITFLLWNYILVLFKVTLPSIQLWCFIVWMLWNYILVLFKVLLRETCIHEQELFFSFLNRLFNTLSWTMTEFSMSIREMQDKHQVNCGIMPSLLLCSSTYGKQYQLGPLSKL
jgi:Kip1 ubiquitination-promoting complex protein 1